MGIGRFVRFGSSQIFWKACLLRCDIRVAVVLILCSTCGRSCSWICAFIIKRGHIEFNPSNHVVKHAETFCLIFYNWVVLSISTKTNSISQLVKSIDMISSTCCLQHVESRLFWNSFTASSSRSLATWLS